MIRSADRRSFYASRTAQMDAIVLRVIGSHAMHAQRTQAERDALTADLATARNKGNDAAESHRRGYPEQAYRDAIEAASAGRRLLAACDRAEARVEVAHRARRPDARAAHRQYLTMQATNPQPGPAPAGTRYAPSTRPAPVRAGEAIISATLQHATGSRPAVLLTRHTVYIDTRAGSIATGNGMIYALAPGAPVILARRDALSIGNWRNILTAQP